MVRNAGDRLHRSNGSRRSADRRASDATRAGPWASNPLRVRPRSSPCADHRTNAPGNHQVQSIGAVCGGPTGSSRLADPRKRPSANSSGSPDDDWTSRGRRLVLAVPARTVVHISDVRCLAPHLCRPQRQAREVGLASVPRSPCTLGRRQHAVGVDLCSKRAELDVPALSAHSVGGLGPRLVRASRAIRERSVVMETSRPGSSPTAFVAVLRSFACPAKAGGAEGAWTGAR
jgi:hypothetical protein